MNKRSGVGANMGYTCPMALALTINSDSSLQSAIGDLRDMYRQHRFVKLTAKTGKPRSLDQSALSHVWYDQLARELREYSALGYKAFCKLHFGVPILRAEEEWFRENYDARIKNSFSYEQKLVVMETFPVTSLMTKPQLSVYLEAMQAHFADRVRLEFPEEA